MLSCGGSDCELIKSKNGTYTSPCGGVNRTSIDDRGVSMFSLWIDTTFRFLVVYF